MVFTHGPSAHLPCLATRAGVGRITLGSGIVRFVQGGVVADQFHMDEPWDRPHNIKLLDQMPEVYRSPNSTHSNRTVYQALVCEGAVMNGKKKGTSFQAIRDGSSNTILFVETDDEVAQPWTKPVDLDFNPDNPMNGLGHMRAGGFQAVFCDGSTHFIPNTIQWKMLKWLVQINDGQNTRF